MMLKVDPTISAQLPEDDGIPDFGLNVLIFIGPMIGFVGVSIAKLLLTRMTPRKAQQTSLEYVLEVR